MLDNYEYMMSISPYSYYNENIFGLEDVLLYKAVYCIYSAEYSLAI